MSNDKKNILLVDDQVEILNSLERLLKDDYNIFKASSGEGALKFLDQTELSVVLADQRMPGMTGVEFLGTSLTMQPDIIRILVTAYADIQASIDAVNKGQIFYYISKPWEPDDLRLIVQRAIDHYELKKKNVQLTKELKRVNEQLQQENIYLRQNIREDYNFSTIIGHSPRML